MKNEILIGFKGSVCLIFFFLIFLFQLPPTASAQQHGDLVKMQGDTKIYFIQNGQRRAIASEEVFRQMGFKMEDVKELDPQTVMNIPEGPPLWSKETVAPYPDGTLVRLKGKAQAYVIRGGRKCYIPDPETFQAYGFQWDQVIEVDQSTFNKIPTGVPIASVKPPYHYGQPGTVSTPPPGASPYPYPPPPYPSQTYPPSTYPPPSSPPPQPYQYPPPSGTPPPSYPPPSYPPSVPPPSKPSSRLPGEPLSLAKRSSVTAGSIIQKEKNGDGYEKCENLDYPFDRVLNFGSYIQ